MNGQEAMAKKMIPERGDRQRTLLAGVAAQACYRAVFAAGLGLMLVFLGGCAWPQHTVSGRSWSRTAAQEEERHTLTESEGGDWSAAPFGGY